MSFQIPEQIAKVEENPNVPDEVKLMLRNARTALYIQGRIHDITMEHNHDMLPLPISNFESTLILNLNPVERYLPTKNRTRMSGLTVQKIESLPVLSAIVKVQRYKSMVTATIHRS